MKRDKHKDKERHALLAAAALQDHMARRLRMPGGPVVQPSLQPGAPMTLAQHLGLIPRPPPLLTEDQWTEVHLRSRLRLDSAAECVICREEFQAGAQVLLSCSHTFHRHCLAAFERYSRCKTCPLCRAEQYQKRTIRDGEQIYRTKCATRIQAAWRGYTARKRYRELRRHQPPRDERLRKKWAAERLQEENDRLLSAMEDEVGDLDDLFAELDASVAASRQVCDAALRPLAARLHRDLQQREATDREGPGSERTGRSSRHGGDDDNGRSDSRQGQGESPLASTSGRQLESAEGSRTAAALPLVESGIVAPAVASSSRRVLLERLVLEAPPPPLGANASGSSLSSNSSINRSVRGNNTSTSSRHMQGAADALGYSGAGVVSAGGTGAAGGGGGSAGQTGEAAGRPATAADVDWEAVVARARARGSLECPICLGDISRRGNEGIAWLSCTHCFHLDCIMAFEAFELASGGTPSCPVCRSGYRRRCFT